MTRHGTGHCDIKKRCSELEHKVVAMEDLVYNALEITREIQNKGICGLRTDPELLKRLERKLMLAQKEAMK